MQRAVRPILLTLMTLVLGCSAALAQNSMDERGIHVTGTGTVYGEPDLALIDLGVDVADEDLSLAIAGANERMRDIMRALAAAGVDERDMRTTDFNIWREERYGADNQREDPLYHVSNILEITVREVERAGELLDIAIEAGANEVRNIRYTFDNPDELERSARELAMEDARDTALQLAELAGVELGAVKEIHENGFAPPQPYASARVMTMDAAESVPVSGGQLAVSVSLQVSFEIAGDGAETEEAGQ